MPSPVRPAPTAIAFFEPLGSMQQAAIDQLSEADAIAADNGDQLSDAAAREIVVSLADVLERSGACVGADVAAYVPRRGGAGLIVQRAAEGQRVTLEVSALGQQVVLHTFANNMLRSRTIGPFEQPAVYFVLELARLSASGADPSWPRPTT